MKAHRKAARKLERWRKRWAPSPLGRGARKRAIAARAREVAVALETAASAGRSAQLLYDVEAPRSRDGVRSAGAMRHALTDHGEALLRRGAHLRRLQHLAAQRADAIKRTSWREFYNTIRGEVPAVIWWGRT